MIEEDIIHQNVQKVQLNILIRLDEVCHNNNLNNLINRRIWIYGFETIMENIQNMYL